MVINSTYGFDTYLYPTSLKRILIYDASPRLFIYKWKTLSFQVIWASSDEISKKDIGFSRVDKPSLYIWNCEINYKFLFYLLYKTKNSPVLENISHNARLRLGEPSTMYLDVNYLLQPILSACLRTKVAVFKGFLTRKVDGLLC